MDRHAAADREAVIVARAAAGKRATLVDVTAPVDASPAVDGLLVEVLEDAGSDAATGADPDAAEVTDAGTDAAPAEQVGRGIEDAGAGRASHHVSTKW